MELDFLQKKYPEFVYESCGWKIEDRDLKAVFYFRLGEIEFHPSIIVHQINMGLAEIPSYWKAACSPKIVVKAGYLNKEQILFWQGLISNMGQFFYENKLPFIKPIFEVAAPKTNRLVAAQKIFLNRYLVPLGGGKDSLVTLEIMRGLNKEVGSSTSGLSSLRIRGI